MASDDKPNNSRRLLMIPPPNMIGRKEVVSIYSGKWRRPFNNLSNRENQRQAMSQVGKRIQ